MFPNGLFNNPWHSWHSPSQLEDVQTVCQNDLFDDEMSSTSDPADHTSSTTTLTQSQVDTSSFSAHAPAHTSNSVQHAASQHEVLELESHVNIWKKMDGSRHSHGTRFIGGWQGRRNLSTNSKGRYSSRESLQSDLKQGEKAQTHRWYRFSTDQVQTPTDPTDPQTPQI
ncbi:hypothetical protein EDD17DRAFT_1512524 [Pisolithus thermaeus]|nr:hypothetical protein EDD17DRAFT_1512524 [Pisolithus thermaeus]